MLNCKISEAGNFTVTILLDPVDSGETHRLENIKFQQRKKVPACGKSIRPLSLSGSDKSKTRHRETFFIGSKSLQARPNTYAWYSFRSKYLKPVKASAIISTALICMQLVQW